MFFQHALSGSHERPRASIRKRLLGAVVMSAASIAYAHACQPAPRRPPPQLPAAGIDAKLSAHQIKALTADAFYWGLNIAEFYELRYLYTQFSGQPAYRGVNRLKALDHLMDASVRYATTVNATTLYSGGAFDVSSEPIVVEAPAVAGNRYWTIQALDQYADWFLRAGSQFTGNGAQRFLVVGPEWHGHLPAGFRSTQIIEAPSNSFMLTTRVAVKTGDKLPPVTEFWSLPIYDSAGYLVDNPIDRYSITSYRLAAGAYTIKNGKVTFYLQPNRPADPDKARNWLPTPRNDNFQIAARFYGPMSPLVDGSYRMPTIKRVH